MSNSFSQRVCFTHTEMVGQIVTAHLTDGSAIEGVFASFDFERKAYLLLKVHRIASAADSNTALANAEETVVLPVIEMLRMESRFVREDTSLTDRVRLQQMSKSLGFGGGENRDLQNWADDLDGDDDSFLEEERVHSQGQWDQFQANRHLVSGPSTYDENLYTTPLPSHITSEQQEHINRKMREIEGSKTLNYQHAIDRGLVPEVEMDEESLYSSVIRAEVPTVSNHRTHNQSRAQQQSAANAAPLPPPTQGSYIPPHKRGSEVVPSPKKAVVAQKQHVRLPQQVDHERIEADAVPSSIDQERSGKGQITSPSRSAMELASSTKKLNPDAKPFMVPGASSAPAPGIPSFSDPVVPNQWRPPASSAGKEPWGLTRMIAARLFNRLNQNMPPPGSNESLTEWRGQEIYWDEEETANAAPQPVTPAAQGHEYGYNAYSYSSYTSQAPPFIPGEAPHLQHSDGAYPHTLPHPAQSHPHSGPPLPQQPHAPVHYGPTSSYQQPYHVPPQYSQQIHQQQHPPYQQQPGHHHPPHHHVHQHQHQHHQVHNQQQHTGPVHQHNPQAQQHPLPPPPPSAPHNHQHQQHHQHAHHHQHNTHQYNHPGPQHHQQHGQHMLNSPYHLPPHSVAYPPNESAQQGMVNQQEQNPNSYGYSHTGYSPPSLPPHMPPPQNVADGPHTGPSLRPHPAGSPTGQPYPMNPNHGKNPQYSNPVGASGPGNHIDPHGHYQNNQQAVVHTRRGYSAQQSNAISTTTSSPAYYGGANAPRNAALGIEGGNPHAAYGRTLPPHANLGQPQQPLPNQMSIMSQPHQPLPLNVNSEQISQVQHKVTSNNGKDNSSLEGSIVSPPGSNKPNSKANNNNNALPPSPQRSASGKQPPEARRAPPKK